MSIRVKTLKAAVSEAKRFIEAAEIVEREVDKNEYDKGHIIYEGGQYCAAMKRASMDLSRALAEVRRPAVW